MGMYDEIVCDYALEPPPPTWVGPGHRYQTKDLDCVLATYRIDPEGRLLLVGTLNGPLAEPEPVVHHGELEFHASNIRGSGPALYTRNGEDAESVGYTALYDRGRLVKIERTYYERTPAFPVSANPLPPKPTPEELARRKARQAESLLGRRLVLARVGFDRNCEEVEVVAENAHEWCVRKLADDRFELVDRRSRDHTLFDTTSDVLFAERVRREDWTEKEAAYHAYCRSKGYDPETHTWIKPPDAVAPKGLE